MSTDPQHYLKQAHDILAAADRGARDLTQPECESCDRLLDAAEVSLIALREGDHSDAWSRAVRLRS